MILFGGLAAPSLPIPVPQGDGVSPPRDRPGGNGPTSWGIAPRAHSLGEWV